MSPHHILHVISLSRSFVLEVDDPETIASGLLCRAGIAPASAIYALRFRLFAPLRFLKQIRLALFYPGEQIKQLVGREQDGIHVIARLQEIHTRRQARDLDVFHFACSFLFSSSTSAI